MPVHVVQHPLVEDVLARLRDKTTPSEEFRQLSPTGWRCSSWLKPPATCPCRTSRPDGGHGRVGGHGDRARRRPGGPQGQRSEEHTSELQSRLHLVCRLLLEKKKTSAFWPTSSILA